MEQLYFITIAITTLLFVLNISKIKTHKENIFLSVLLFITIIGELVIILNFRGLSNRFLFLISIVNAFPSLLGPISFLYVKSVLNHKFKYSLRHNLIFVPFLITLILSFYVNYFVNNILIISIILDIILKNISSFVFIVLSIFTIKKYRQNILSKFSYTENIDFKWLNYLIYTELFVWILYLLLIILWVFDVSIIESPEIFINICISVFIFLIGFYGLRNTSVFSSLSVSSDKNLIEKEEVEQNLQHNKTTTIQQNKTLLKSEELENYFIKLTEYLEKEKPYLNEKLSLQDLSVQTKIHQRYLSEIINLKTGMNFFDYINSYRINYFNKILSSNQNQNFTLLGNAFECGFGSKSSFNRAYKKHTGVTPSEFKKNLNSQKS